jgi:Cu(I)/Ag(I) efflux system membrane protein CusA/SilA
MSGVSPGPNQPRPSLIAALIATCARRPAVTILLVGLAGLWGFFALRNISLDAVPDLSDVQVIVFSEWTGQSPDLIEDQITYPITSALVSAPRVSAVRGQSMFGMSFVNVIFDEGTDLYWARTRVIEALDAVRGKLPEGVNPKLGPDASAIGWVFEYALVDKTHQHDLQALRSLQDWNVRYALASVPGVAEVASVGGYVKQFQVDVDPDKLTHYGITLDDVVRAVRDSNREVGGRVLEISGTEHVIRGRGYVKTPEDIGLSPLTRVGETRVRVRDVAAVSVGPDQRRGLSELNGEGEAPGGIVIMRDGQNARNVIAAVKARLGEVARSLPAGVELVTTYDRSELIAESVSTLERTLLEEMLIVSLVIFVLLWHARSALIPILTLPLGVLLAFIPMYYQQLSANIMSLGGIAVAIGAMVDGSIVIIENIHKRLADWQASGRVGPRRDAIIEAMQEVGPAIFFSLVVMAVAFLPVLTLQASEGRLFRPLTYTKTYAIGFAAILAVTLTPALAVLLIRGTIRDESAHPINRVLRAGYAPLVRFVVTQRWPVIIGALVIFALSIPIALRLPSEFMPPLNEGVLLYMPTAPAGMSEHEAARVLSIMDRELKTFPEVQSVFGKQGRAETATDPAPLGMAEIMVVLKPFAQWRRGLSWSELLRQLNDKLQIPGMPNLWWMPIQTRTEMLATGVRSPLGIEVFGDDLDSIERAASEVQRVVSKVPGTRSAFAERASGGFYIDVEIKREPASHWGLRAADIAELVAQAIGGQSVSEVVDGRARYPISVRFAAAFRTDPEKLGSLLIATPDGLRVPLSQVSTIRHVIGPAMLRSEGGKLVSFVFVDTDRPIVDYVREAKTAVEREAKLPTGTRLDWVGQFKSFERARQRLGLVLPLTLGIVMLLLYLGTRSFVASAIVLLAVPFSLVGAVWLLSILHYHVSVAVWVGLIALAGLDAETGVVMLLYLSLTYERRLREGSIQSYDDLRECIVEGAAKRLRPKLMTVATMMLGLLPVLLSQRTGADVMKPMAAPMIGGLATSFLLELAVYPALFAVWKGRGLATHVQASSPRHADHA